VLGGGPSTSRSFLNRARRRKEFGTFTADSMSLVDWLAQCAAKSVVMEATGVYWVNLYELLERLVLGSTWSMPTRCVTCVAAPKVTSKTVNGFCRLHSCGLLEASFRPPAQIRQLHNYHRSRSKIVDAAAQQQFLTGRTAGAGWSSGTTGEAFKLMILTGTIGLATMVLASNWRVYCSSS